MSAKNFGELLDLLQDIADEYPETLDQPVLTESEKGDVMGAVISVDLDAQRVWFIFEEQEES